MFVNRGDNGDATDNNAIITQILQLRAERAKLLGFPTHAHWRLENTMAKTPERAMELMEARLDAGRRAGPRRSRRHAEDRRRREGRHQDRAVGLPLLRREGAQGEVRPRRDEIKPYLQLENLREGMFHMAKELFGFSFKPVDAGKVPVYHPDVRVWEVTNPTGRADRPLVLRLRTRATASARARG